MGVRIDIGLDLDGLHTFAWQPSDDPHAVDVPLGTLERWSAERDAFLTAFARWKEVIDEIEDALFRSEHSRSTTTAAAKAEVMAVPVAAPTRKRCAV